MLSPLRYPGGKAKLFSYFIHLISENNLYDKIYAEPYAGGAGLALKLLAHGYVKKIELNDIDPAISAFWRSILRDTDRFCSLIYDAKLSVDEWHRQKNIYMQGRRAGDLELGFSAYFINRTSRSGIIEGSGPIGGYSQAGNWRIDARFNKDNQISQIMNISRYSDNISVSCEDAYDFINEKISDPSRLTYLDPPYYVKGKNLYKNFYSHEDHLKISELLKNYRNSLWVLSYDYAPEIRHMYKEFPATIYSLQYSAGASGKGSEIIFSGDQISLPNYEGFSIAA